MSKFLGLQVQQNSDYIVLHQNKYAKDILKMFGMESCKATATPLATGNKHSKDDGGDQTDETNYRSLIGCLLYLSATRLDIMFAASLMSRFMQRPVLNHLTATKRILRYIKGTLDYGLKFNKFEGNELFGFCDSNWARSFDDSRSTSGLCFSFGNAMFTWNSRKQDIVAQSSTEAEYVAVASATNQALCLEKCLLI